MLIQYVAHHVDGLGLVVPVHIRVSQALEFTLFSVPYCIQRQSVFGENVTIFN